jgi:hypothetical protein
MDLTAALPIRLTKGLIAGPVALITATPLIWIGFTLPGLAIFAKFFGALCLFAGLLFPIILWQVLCYRNPVLQIRQDALIFYGTAIPWTAIQSTYVGTANFALIAAREPDAQLQDRLWLNIPDDNSLKAPPLSRLITYHLAKAMMHRTGGQLLLPLVRERSVEELAGDIQAKMV